MAHRILKEPFIPVCPRCGCTEARLLEYHFGASWVAECAGCGFGKVDGDDSETAKARLKGKYLEEEQRRFEFETENNLVRVKR